MFSGHHRKVKVLFGLSDIVLTALAFEAAYQSRVWLPLEHAFFLTVATKALLLGFASLACLAIGRSLDIYDRLDSGHPRTIVRESLRQALLLMISVVLFQYLVRLDLSRGFLSLLAAYEFIILSLSRLCAGSLVGVVRREFGVPHYVVVVGTGKSARRLGDALEGSERYGIRLVGFLAANPESEPQRLRLRSEYEVLPLADLRALLRKRVIDEVIFAVEDRRLDSLDDILVLCDEEGVRTRIALDFPHVNSEVFLDRLGSVPLLTFTATPHDEIRLLAKRVTDLLVAAIALVLLAPFLLFIGVVIRLTSPGPVIFRQIRCGLNGRRFMFYKFRSMCADAEAMKQELEHLNRKTTAFKIPDDPRMTRIGRWLRRFSIDELPQLWNVLKGDMSLVGPRPAVPAEVDNYKGWQRRRLRMRPGLTCLWAIEGRDSLDFETWMKMDMEYIDNWSLSLDWKILLLTIPRVLTGKGAY